MTETSLPFAKFTNFQSLVSRKQLPQIELQMVSAISFGWFADAVKPLPLFNGHSNRFIPTNGNHLSWRGISKFSQHVLRRISAPFDFPPRISGIFGRMVRFLEIQQFFGFSGNIPWIFPYHFVPISKFSGFLVEWKAPLSSAQVEMFHHVLKNAK